MSRRILKFEVSPGVTAIETADQPRFLAVGHQTRVVVWGEATPGVGVLTYLYAALTGQEPPPEAEYIGTTQFIEYTSSVDIGLGGQYIVVHVYRRLA